MIDSKESQGSQELLIHTAPYSLDHLLQIEYTYHMSAFSSFRHIQLLIGHIMLITAHIRPHYDFPQTPDL